MLFSLETAESVPSSELPDDFFELTIDDAKKLLRDIKQRQHELENGKLLTSTMRNLEESKKQLRQLNKYKQSIIRIQFPDRSVLQGTFTPTETIGVVSEFVKEYLEDKTLDFYLCKCIKQILILLTRILSSVVKLIWSKILGMTDLIITIILQCEINYLVSL